MVMRRNRERGFTVVELVIVIAIIAILATALIPTFSGLFDGAYNVADKSTARDMNVALTAASITGTLVEIDDVWDVLTAAGFSEKDYTPATRNAAFYWAKGTAYIVLADADMNILYPEDFDAEGKDLIPLIGDPNRLNPADKPTATVLRPKLENLTGTRVNDFMYAEESCSLFSFRPDHDLNGANAADPELVAQSEKYKNWIADFAIILNDDFKANSVGICGQYRIRHEFNFEFDWQYMELPNDVEAGTCFFLMDAYKEAYGIVLTYDFLVNACSTIDGERDSFNCGAYNLSDENIGKSITVELRLYEPTAEDANEKSDKYIVCNTITVTFNSVATPAN